MKKVMAWKLWIFSAAMLAASGSHAAEINFDSATDFIHIDVLLKEDSDRLQSAYEMNVMLSPEAAERIAQLTHASIGQPLTVSVNGRELSTATVHSEIGARIRMIIPKTVAKDLLPTLVD
jgi:preprotein translocase subunit SecD